MFNYVRSADETKRCQTVPIKSRNTPKVDPAGKPSGKSRIKETSVVRQLAGRTKGQRIFARTRTQTRNGVKFPAEHRKYSRQVALLTLQRDKAGLNREDDGCTGRRDRELWKGWDDRSKDTSFAGYVGETTGGPIMNNRYRVSRHSSERLKRSNDRRVIIIVRVSSGEIQGRGIRSVTVPSIGSLLLRNR